MLEGHNRKRNERDSETERKGLKTCEGKIQDDTKYFSY